MPTTMMPCPPPVKSFPRHRSRCRVWFTQELFRREGQNALEVYGPGDQRVDQDDAAIDDDNRKLMTVSLQSDLPNGVYTVRWRTLSADDGDDAEGEFQFTIQADESEAEATPTATSTACANCHGGARPTLAHEYGRAGRH